MKSVEFKRWTSWYIIVFLLLLIAYNLIAHEYTEQELESFMNGLFYNPGKVLPVMLLQVLYVHKEEFISWISILSRLLIGCFDTK